MSAVDDRSATDGDRQRSAFLDGLADEDKMLVRLCQELYEGRWDDMLGDLNDRLHGRPYIFKLASRIQDDIARVQRLSRFEREQNVRLAELLWPDEYGKKG